MSFFCCDVLEHVRDLPKVISEISRVLKPGGVFCFDTLNRTFLSKLVAIKIWQEWKRWAFMPPNLHVWEMFIKPDELKALLLQNQFEVKGSVARNQMYPFQKCWDICANVQRGNGRLKSLAKFL